MVIGRGDRISSVIARDERLIDVLAGLSPHFQRLRNPSLRRVMSRLVTVEQAARIGGLDPDDVVRRLNEALRGWSAAGNAAGVDVTGGNVTGADAPGATAAGAPETAPARTDAPPAAGAPGPEAAPPRWLRELPAARIVDVDVREDLRAGREPFSRIMAARRALPADGVLRLRAIFEPIPLYGVMEKQGLAHWTERLGEEDWRVWFYRPQAEADDAAPPPAGAAAASPAPAAEESPDGDVIVLDVRGLEPPEPMMRTLAALESLPRGSTLVQLNVRVPQFLLPQLEARGFTYEVREQSADLVRVFIRHREAQERRAEVQPGPMEERMAGSGPKQLDVRAIPPRDKHPTIFATFAALEPGESFVLVNDHDPKPLRYQMEAELAGEFGWEYLEQGPEVWRVAISRREA